MKGKEIKKQNLQQNNRIKKKSIKDTILELNQEFDETIYFNHHYTAFRKLKVEKPISQTTVPFLMIREFLFSYFEEKLISKEADKESIAQILGHIKQFSNSHDKDFIKDFLENIKTYAEIIGIKNTSDLLVPSLAKIVDESNQAKIQFLKSLLPFIDYLCSNGEEGIHILKNNMMNIIKELYQQKYEQSVAEEIKKLLFQNFIKISKAILPYDKEQYILNIVIGFGNENTTRDLIKNNAQVDEHKILCIRFIRILAEGIGKENAERFLLPQLISFSCEKSNQIKKELLFALPNLSEIISLEYISTKIYDILRRISNDYNSNLRKICVNVIAKIIKIFKTKCDKERQITKEGKNEKYSVKNFVAIIEKLSKDKEKNIRFTIIEKIGEIISPLDEKELSKDLFDFYKKFVEKNYEEKKNQLPFGATVQGSSSHGSSGNNLYIVNKENKNDYEINDSENEFNKQITEEDLNYYFAYNFPAILYCYGKGAWPELKKLYFDFCFEEDLKIRLSIVASFHEIANILGKEITENELLPVYDKFLESNEKYEQKLAIKNLPKILYKVNKSLKERYFKYFEPVSIFIDNIGSKVRNFNFINWKNKLNVIEGILCYYNLYDNDIIYNSIFPQCITFCLDKFYKVRKTSAKVLANLIIYLYKEDYKKDKLLRIIENFAFHKKFKIRINFIKMCPILMGDENLYKNKIKELLEIIVCKDKILDVKIALAKVLKKIIKDEKNILSKDNFINKLCILLCKNEMIKKIYNDINIKNINEDININNIEDKEYFKEDNSFFMEEFKLEEEKKDNKLNDNIQNNINVNQKQNKNVEEEKDKKDIKIEEAKNENKNKKEEVKNNDEKKEEKIIDKNDEVKNKEDKKTEKTVEKKEEKKKKKKKKKDGKNSGNKEKKKEKGAEKKEIKKEEEKKEEEKEIKEEIKEISKEEKNEDNKEENEIKEEKEINKEENIVKEENKEIKNEEEKKDIKDKDENTKIKLEDKNMELKNEVEIKEANQENNLEKENIEGKNEKGDNMQEKQNEDIIKSKEEEISENK